MLILNVHIARKIKTKQNKKSKTESKHLTSCHTHAHLENKNTNSKLPTSDNPYSHINDSKLIFLYSELYGLASQPEDIQNCYPQNEINSLF